MKVYCKNNNYPKLELNKAYKVTNYIMDDNGNEYLYDRIQFKTLSEIRNEKINKLLE